MSIGTHPPQIVKSLDPGMRDVSAASAAEALRCSVDAVLSHQQSDQPRGERRRGVLRTRGTRTDSGSAVRLAGASTLLE